MAIQEHPYYGSLATTYLIFSASLRFGTHLKALIDVVHLHAVKNTEEESGLYDGVPHQIFHT